MKFLKKTAIIHLFFFSSIFSQNSTRQQAVEIFIGTENVIPTNKSVEFYLTACGAVWGGERINFTENNYYLTTEFNNSTYLVSINNNDQGYWGGWDFVLSRTFNPPNFPVFGWGVYKLSTNASTAYFYFNYLDDRYGNYENYQPPTFGHDADVWVKYDDTGKNFYVNSDGMGNWGSSIFNGVVLNIWDIKHKGLPNTSRFPNFWQNSLVITQTAYNNPRLVWGPHPTFTATNYKVYRAASTTPVSDPSTLTYQLIYTSPNAITYGFTDGDIQIGSGDYIYYYVTAIQVRTPKPTLESSGSNFASVQGGFYKNGNTEGKPTERDLSFSLNPNYPNPFNPSTAISYQLAANSFVTLKVYDVLGNEVATLVNEWQEAGSYSAQFTTSGKQLASGMYFYTLTAGKFTDTKKFILLK